MSPILSQTMTKEKYEKLAKDFPLAKSIFITKNIQGSSGFCGQAIGNAVAHASLHPHTHICLFRGIPAFLRDNRPTNVLLHEYAHVIVLETHHLDAKSHGHEWRFEFKKLLIKYKYPHNEADLSMYSPWRYLTPPRFHILFKRMRTGFYRGYMKTKPTRNYPYGRYKCIATIQKTQSRNWIYTSVDAPKNEPIMYTAPTLKEAKEAVGWGYQRLVEGMKRKSRTAANSDTQGAHHD